MKRINNLCVLLLLLVISSSSYAGVEADGVTAYRLGGDWSWIVFTNNPSDEPDSVSMPLGAGRMIGASCATALGTLNVLGLACKGTFGEPIADYVCDFDAPKETYGTTTWCLYSENPRTGGKAWAVKFVEGEIPTNDGASIVRCEGTDVFDPENGCKPPPPQISIEGGFIKLATTAGGAPLEGFCTLETHHGRMVVDEIGGKLFICTAIGWETITTDRIP